MADPSTAQARAVFIVWGPPHKGPRSLRFASALGVPVFFLADTWRRGLRDPIKYPRLVWRTAVVLGRHRPRVVIVQSPPSLATWVVALYAFLARANFVVDAHSDAFQRKRWTRPAFLNRLVTRRALATVVTDGHWAERVRKAGGRPLVIPDIPTETTSVPVALSAATASFDLVVVNTWADDEPLQEVIAAAEDLPDATFHITGAADERVDALGSLPANVLFTGFLSSDEYAMLMARCSAVVCLTTRDHTMQRGACEALSLAKPIITSDWPILREYFVRGTVHVDNTTAGIRDGIRRLMSDYHDFVQEISELRRLRIADWQARREELMDLFARDGAEWGGRRAGGR